jgi:hypothetical protein
VIYPGCYIVKTDTLISKIISIQMNGAESGKNSHDLHSHSDMITDNTNGPTTNPSSIIGSNVEIVRQQRFEVGPRYTDLKFIGEGAYGK